MIAQGEVVDVRITYDPKADALYIHVSNNSPDHTIVLSDSISADVDKRGQITGIEILDVRKNHGATALQSLTFAVEPDDQAAAMAL